LSSFQLFGSFSTSRAISSALRTTTLQPSWYSAASIFSIFTSSLRASAILDVNRMLPLLM
jgi:hypothetical protein